MKIVPKDNNLGLGAICINGGEDGDSIGLDQFQDILGRLNGENQGCLEKEQRRSSNLRRSPFADQRWQRVRFVTGGLLVSDESQKLSGKQSSCDDSGTVALHISRERAPEKTVNCYMSFAEASKRARTKALKSFGQ